MSECAWEVRQIRAFIDDFCRRVPDVAWRMLGEPIREALLSHEALMISISSLSSSMPATLAEVRQLRIELINRNAIVRAT